MQIPFISVVIPTYNSGVYITETLLSVFNQTYKNYEVIVSDDGSLDNTEEIVKTVFSKFPQKTRFLNNSHAGPGAARNKGIEASNGEWISFLDSDDRWFPQKLHKVAEYIFCNTDTNLVCHSEIQKIGKDERLLRYSDLYDSRQKPFLSLYKKNALSTSAVTVKKELLMKTSLFDTTLPAAQDYDLWLQLAIVHGISIGFIDEPLGFYMTRSGNISSNIEQRLHCMLKINSKHSKNLQQACRFAGLESLAYEGRVYTSAGLELICMGNFKKGMVFFISGLFKWPFRFDWIYKFISQK